MKISVIVPVYNAEKYLKRCIESVVAQTYKNWEMIMVDDGSKDNSAVIIDEAAARDNRIIAIHQVNAGAGEARNTGIDLAKGDYVVFLDSDDYIDSEYFLLLVSKARTNDVVFVDTMQVDENGKCIECEFFSKYKSKSTDFLIRAQMTGKIPWGGVRKAASLCLLRTNNIRYTNHRIGEEALYSYQLLSAARKIGFLDEKPVYFYVNHENSLSKSIDIDPWGGVAEILADYTKKQGSYKEYAHTINAFRITALIVSLDRITQYYSGAERKNKVKRRMNSFNENYDFAAGIDIKNMSYKAKVFLPFVMKKVIFPIIWVSRLRCIVRGNKSNKISNDGQNG